MRCTGIVQQGKARAVGLSNFTLDQIKECTETRRIDVVEYGLNMFDRRTELEMFPYFLEQGIGVMVYAPLAFRLLTGTFTADITFGENDWRRTGADRGLTQGCSPKSISSATCGWWRD